MGWWDNVKQGWEDGGIVGATLEGVGLGAADRLDNQWADQNRNDFNAPGYDQRNAYYGQQLQDVGNRQAYLANDSAFRRDQQQLAGMLMRQAQGQDSLSREQLRQGQMANVASQQAMAASARPGQGAMALRQAMGNAARTGYGMSGQAAMAGIAERNAAAQSLGGVLSGARGQDMALSQFNAQQQMANRGANDQFAQALMQNQLNNAQMQQQGNLAYAQDVTNRFGIAAGTPTATEQYFGAGQSIAGLAMMGSGGGAAAGAGGAQGMQNRLGSILGGGG